MDYVFIAKSIFLQVIVFCAIPFVYWLIQKRKTCSFFECVGV